MRKLIPLLLMTSSLLLSACGSTGGKSTVASPPSNASSVSDRIANLANNGTSSESSVTRASSVRPNNGGNGLPLAQYLSSGRQDIVKTFCDPQSPNHVSSMGIGNQCQNKVYKLFDYCTKQELNGILADPITNRQEADTTAIVVFDCIFANHSGPEAVAQFRATLQKAIQQKISQGG